jgi:hypothetical protein
MRETVVLPDAARAGEQVGVMQALGGQRIRQRLDDVLLPDHLLEVLGTVFAGEHEIGHRRILGVGRDRYGAGCMPVQAVVKRQAGH